MGAPTTPILGRERELEAIAGRLAQGDRLVTITGLGGIGKTRIAAALARSIASEELAVLRADLTDASGREGLLDAVALAAGAAAAGKGKRHGWLSRALAAHGPAVLILDPFDRLLEHAELLGEWLAGAPELAIVVVSRGRLRSPDEVVIEIGPLVIEPRGSAVELLIGAARAHRHDYAPSDEERKLLAEIARELDGVPLALELAASRLGVLGPAALLHRLRSRFEILRRPGASGDRHGALEASIAWSWEVLDPAEREVLAQCTTFRGGFSVEAAEAVIEMPAGSPSVIDVIESLRAKSLIRAEQSAITGELRLSLYESVRAFAVRGLPSARELEARHAKYAVEAAEAWSSAIETREGDRARALLILERENLLAVVERILGRGAVSARTAELALRALVALAPVLMLRGPLEVLAGHLERALEVTAGSGADPRLQARGLLARAGLRRERGDVAGAERDLSEALVLAHHANDASAESRVLLAIAGIAMQRGELDRAEAGIDRATELAERAGDAGADARAMLARARIEEQRGQRGAARGLLERALVRVRAMRSAIAEAPIRRRLAVIEMHEGRIADARAHLEAAAELARALEDRRGAALTRALLALADHLEGDLGAAKEGYQAAIAELSGGGFSTLEASAQGLLGLVHAERGERTEARLLVRAARTAIEGTDAALEIFFGGALARIEAASGVIEAARAALVSARMRLAETADPALAQLIDALEASLEHDLPATDPLAPSIGIALLSRLRARSPASRPPPGREDALRVGEGGSWFRAPGGERVDLSKRKPLKRILERLAQEREASPARALAWDDLLASGWPGEKMRADAGAHRVRVAISTLRKLGLRDALLTREEGYLLDPGLALERGA